MSTVDKPTPSAAERPGSASSVKDGAPFGDDAKHQLPSSSSSSGSEEEDAGQAKDLTVTPAYTGKRSWWRATFTQATILGVCSFLSPGIWGAMSATGGGGQSSAAVSWNWPVKPRARTLY
jgi:hypothetical protein